MSYIDQKYIEVARYALDDIKNPTEAEVRRVAQYVQDMLEQEVSDVLMDRDKAREAAKGEYIDRLIDERRGA